MRHYYENVNITELNNQLARTNEIMFSEYKGSMGRAPFLYEIESGGYWKGFLCAGETGVIYGKQKTMKSFFLLMLIIAHLNKNGTYQNVKCHMHPDKYILFQDTEMYYDTFYKRCNIALYECGLRQAPHNFLAFPCKTMHPVMRLHYLIHMIEKYQDNIGLVIIDKWQDLLISMSNEDQVTSLVNCLGQLQAKYGFMIVETVHKNKNNDQINGISGGRALREAAHALTVSRVSPEVENSDIVIQSDFETVRHGEMIKPFWMNVELKEGITVPIIKQMFS